MECKLFFSFTFLLRQKSNKKGDPAIITSIAGGSPDLAFVLL
jgi:hypothetical protein